MNSSRSGVRRGVIGYSTHANGGPVCCSSRDVYIFHRGNGERKEEQEKEKRSQMEESVGGTLINQSGPPQMLKSGTSIISVG